MPKKIIKYAPSPSPQIMACLVQGDCFKEMRNQRDSSGNWIPKPLKHTLMHTPVFMEHSGNWTARVFQQKSVDADKPEFIYINKTNITRFTFRESDVKFYLSQKAKNKLKSSTQSI